MVRPSRCTSKSPPPSPRLRRAGCGGEANAASIDRDGTARIAELDEHRDDRVADAPRVDDVRAAVEIDVQHAAFANDADGAQLVADRDLENHRSASVRPASRQRLAAGAATPLAAGLVKRCTAAAIAARSSCAASIGRSGPLAELAVDEAGVEPGRLEVLVVEDPLEERNRRANAAHLVFGERAAHALNRVLARVAPGDQLRDQRIVEDRDLAALVGAAVVAHTGSLRNAQSLDPPRRRQEAVVGVFRVDAAFDGVRLRVEQRVRIQVEPLASRDANLPLHQVDARHHLGDRVLDLQARVHLQEVERSVLVEQEFDRAGVGVTHRFRNRRRGRRHAPPELRRDRQRRALFDDLLVTPLDRALALDERQHGAVMIAEQLHFDVARRHDPALEIHRTVTECRLRLRSGGA